MSIDDLRPVPTHRDLASRDLITRWLLLVAFLIVVMVIVGGYTRLSRAGLSIVEWDVVTGILPPIGEEAWQESFDAYQQTPEYQLVNDGMTLSEYKQIYYIEWAHRIIGRIAGMLVVLPLLWFMFKRYITPKESIKYWLIAAGFGIQGAIGWIMVSSGLEDRPAVSEIRLTIHLLAALTLLGIVLWMAFDRMAGASKEPPPGHQTRFVRALSWITFVAVVVQISWGGIVAGLKAGYLSDTWPEIFGHLVPPGMFTIADTWFMSMFEPLTSHWIHRWFAFVVLFLTVGLYFAIRRAKVQDHFLQRWAALFVASTSVQIFVGIATILLGVPKYIALLHQGVGITVFCVSLVVAHRIEAGKRVTVRKQVATRASS